jgi:holo-[acyl-carrier protein] synthase
MSVAGVGMDVVEVERARAILARHGERALVRFLTVDERAYVMRQPDPAPHFAVRVAAKEAAYKALQSLPGMRAVGWHDLEVSRQPDGRPQLELRGLAARLTPDWTLHLSLTHTRAVAGAVVVLATRSPRVTPS